LQQDLDLDGLGDACDPDKDGDGSSVPADCNDTNPNIHPGVVELCNGIDENCNGRYDETFDADGDNYTTCATFVPNGGFTTYTDCNDLNASINPGAIEDCALVDLNCNGFPYDELYCPGAPLLVYADPLYFNGRTTNLSAAADLSNAVLTLENTTFGMFYFHIRINFTRSLILKWPSVFLGRNRAVLNSSALPMLNKAARITFYNLSLLNPRVLRDSTPCPDAVCTGLAVSGKNISFNVTSFSEYSIQGRCADGTPYDECSSPPPAYCLDGSIVDRCDLCGCPSGYTCSGTTCSQSTGPVIPPTRGPSGGPSTGGPTTGGACTQGQTIACGTETGRCTKGTQTCTSGKWGECTGGILPQAEQCNGADDDCDGLIDEDIQCECQAGQSRPCGLETGRCSPGYRLCVQGKWAAECTDETGPVAEICSNGIDDDCDGATDEEGCISGAGVDCSDGPIVSPCKCEGEMYTEGYCYNGYYFKDKPDVQGFPWEVLSYIGGAIISAMLLVVVVRQVRQFRKIGKQVSQQDMGKVPGKAAAKGAGAMSVSEITNEAETLLGQDVKVSGYVQFSNKTSDSEYWYSFYDSSASIPLMSPRELKNGRCDVNVTVMKTALGYFYLELKGG